MPKTEITPEPAISAPTEPVPPEILVDADVRKLTISLLTITGIKPSFPVSEIHVTANFLTECVLETPKYPACDQIELEQTVELDFDLNKRESFDKFVSNPILITVIETECETDGTLLPDLPPGTGRALWMSEESVADLDEALEGPAVVDSSKKSEKSKATTSSKSKGGKKSKDKLSKSSKDKGSKTSKTSKAKIKTTVASKVGFGDIKPAGGVSPPIVVGIGVIDLITLFLGQEYMEETILLKGIQNLILDDRTKSVAKLPKIEICVKIDKPLPSGSIINLTIESMYNIPSVMTPDMNYQLVINLPSSDKSQTIKFSSCSYEKVAPKKFLHKKWYGTNIESDYWLETDFNSVKNNLKIDVSEAVRYDVARLDFNVIKRNYVGDEDLDMFRMQIVKHRCIAVEVYAQKLDKEEEKSNVSSGNSKEKVKKLKPEKSSKVSKGKKGSKVSAEIKPADLDQPDYLHLMAFVDLCKLLYPGTTNVRVTCPLQTYNEIEVLDMAGQQDSFFRPRPPPPPPPPVLVETVQSKGKMSPAEKKGAKASSNKDSSKSSGKKGGKAKESKIGNLQIKLPPAPPLPVPSKPVYNEEGLPTFLIVELELRTPLVAARTLDDITDELHELIYDTDDKYMPKNVKSEAVTQELYRETIRTLAEDLKLQYQDYIEADLNSELGKGDADKDFLTYLQHKGVYQTYLSSITRAASIFVNTIYDYDPNISSSEYQTFISEVYVRLINEMNAVIGSILKCGLEQTGDESTNADKLLTYAREASEIGAYALANRYYLQRICEEETNADYWFDYAVYHMQIGEKERALECAKEALKSNPNQRGALVIYAMLLDQAGMSAEAETCLLNLTFSEKKWVEGWGALYCSYLRRNYEEGMEVSLEMANKFLDKSQPMPTSDLAWTNRTLPDNVFYRTASYMIGLRLFDEAELVLSQEIFKKESGVNEYLLAVIAYYKEQYDHALLHVDNSVHLHGCDYAVASLRGHILMSMGDQKCALEEYQKIFNLYTKPKDEYIYLVYVRSALAYSKLGDTQKARTLFLHACKLQGSPFIWLCVGILYYYQNDLQSAEECLSQANVMDNKMAEVWAYLTLVSIKLGNKHEANLCFRQVIEHKLQNLELMDMVKEAIEKLV